MSTTQLRPLGIGEILDVAIKTFTKNARTLITIGAIVGVPFQLLSGLVQLSTVTSADQVGGASFSLGSTMPVAFSRAQVAGLVVTTLIGLLVSLVLTAATVKAVSDAYLGNVPSVGDSLRFGLRRIRSLIWLYLLMGLGLLFAAIAFLIPAVWLLVAWSVATPVLLIEDVRGAGALRRSFRLVRHRWWATAGVQVVAGLMVAIVTGVLTGLLVIIPHAIDGSSVLLAVIGSTIAASIAGALVHPLQGAVVSVLYFDLRVRKEGFDLTLLAAGVGLPETSFSPAPGGVAPIGPSEYDIDGEAPPFWPPPPGWKPTPRPAGQLGEPAAEPPPQPPGWDPPGPSGATRTDE